MQQLKMLISGESILFNAYLNSDYLPMWNFIQAITLSDSRYILKLNDYQYLPELNSEQRKHIDGQFDFILDEYYQLDVSQVTNNIFNLQKKIELNLNKIIVYEALYYMAAIDLNQETINYINKNGFNFNISDDADDILNKIKLKIELCVDIINSNKKAIKKEKDIDSKGNDFNYINAQLSRLQGHEIDLKKISVSEYVSTKKSIIEGINKNDKDGRSNKK